MRSWTVKFKKGIGMITLMSMLFALALNPVTSQAMYEVRGEELFVENYYTDQPYLVSEGVEDIESNMFLKDGVWHMFMDDGTIKELPELVDVQQIWSGGNAVVYLDSQKNVWLKGGYYVNSWEWDYVDKPLCTHFAYKTEERGIYDLRVVETNVDKLWVNDYGMAFVREGKLYGYGELNTVFGEASENLTRFKGIKVNKIREVNYTPIETIIVMKSGQIYSIPTENSYYADFSKVKKVKKKHLMKPKKIYSKAVAYNGTSLKMKNGKTRIWWYYKKTRNVVLKNVKEYHYGDIGSNYLLKNNGKLFCWGYNRVGNIDIELPTAITYKKKHLLAENIKEVAYSHSGANIFYLNEEGQLYFKGYNAYV